MSIYAVTAPPSVNRMWRFGNTRFGKSDEYTAWLNVAGIELNCQRARRIAGPVQLTITAPANSRRDLDNHAKGSIDLLCKMNLIDGDRFKTVKRIVMEWHDKPAMLIAIAPFGPASLPTPKELSTAIAKRQSAGSRGM